MPAHNRRSKTGTVGTGVGFNANVLMSKNGGLSPWLYTGVSVSKTGEKYRVVSAQEHHMFDNELTKDAALKRKNYQGRYSSTIQ